MLPGVRIKDLKKIPDERGFFAELLRKDWKEYVDKDDEFVQSNLSMTYPSIIRAWHRHDRGQIDNFVVLGGSYKICAYDDKEDSPTKGQLDEIVASEEKLQIIRIPGHYWHGSKVVSSEPGLILYFVTRLYDYKNPDEERRPWNDPKIIDPRTNQPYDWNKTPHK